MSSSSDIVVRIREATLVVLGIHRAWRGIDTLRWRRWLRTNAYTGVTRLTRCAGLLRGLESAIGRELAKRSLKQHRGHWWRTYDERGQDKTQPSLLHRHAGDILTPESERASHPE